MPRAAERQVEKSELEVVSVLSRLHPHSPDRRGERAAVAVTDRRPAVWRSWKGLARYSTDGSHALFRTGILTDEDFAADRDLLARPEVARVALRTPTGPEILPVNYAGAPPELCFRTTPYGVLGSSAREGDLAVETDSLAPESLEGLPSRLFPDEGPVRGCARRPGEVGRDAVT